MDKDIMRVAGFGEEVKKVEQGLCPFCNKKVRIEDFKDNLSLKEYKISGLCQSCQDGFFGK